MHRVPARAWRFLTWLCALLCALLPAFAHAVAPTASALFELQRERVFQVRVVDVGSGDKTAIGSGFRVRGDGLIATNFHVVSLLIHEPAKYRLELLGQDGRTEPGTVIGIDVLNDLAIVRGANAAGPAFTLLADSLDQGERIFSMGNPEDLGMTIIEGNYNGHIAASRFDRLLFSGSLNPGMSGGPAFDRTGTVIGVNVAKGGEQLSFLVPVAHLRALIERSADVKDPGDLKQGIARTLRDNANAYFDELIAASWQRAPFGELTLPRKLSSTLKCWGHNVDKKDIDYAGFHQHCVSEEYLFLRDDFYTGNFSYSYEWMRAGKLNPFQFYSAVTRHFTHTNLDNVDDEEYVTNFECHTDFVQIDDTPWKASICLRRYREYAGLYDASLVMASLHASDRAAIVRMGAAGIHRKRALALFAKLMKSIAWKH